MVFSARDEAKAKAFATKHAIPKVYSTYEALLEDPEIQAVYIPTPNALHHKWTIAALKAGKHVLCEKPLANNEKEAQEMVDTAKETGKVLMEAFHYRYHPAAQRVRDIVASGELGEIKSCKVVFYIVGMAFKADDIRFNLALGGGALVKPPPLSLALPSVRLILFIHSSKQTTRWTAAATPFTQ